MPTGFHSDKIPPWSTKPIWTKYPYSTYDGSALSEQQPTVTPTPLVTDGPGPTSTSGDVAGDGSSAGSQGKHGSNHRALYAAAGIVPLVVLAFLGLIIFFYLRKRKRQQHEGQKQARAKAQEMRMRNQPHPYIQPHYTSPITESHYTAPPPTLPPPVASSVTPQPVILGPIVPGSNGAYYTGIDTSDVVSIPDRTGLGNPFADGDGLDEEPPPPYRPRSIAPLSRDTSLRAPPSAHWRTNLTESHDQGLRSPFEDPRDDDTVSDISGPTLRRNDAMSAVSDLSYQEDPVVGRPTL
ncbi:hypothetical protein K469DRAFT_546724 [Zopfia rhizophila CBS 207.26]|uniref:Uncharacterized protein n=1 Tax=Zopfia rhizophila CBS 207.26 TaxID=1314779 RepID=A0A6A6EUJ3_9PEZI|nr:hypothetical protein K469DRAFT_546724 [Zopfia rhizophila CBS 207.26]